MKESIPIRLRCGLKKVFSHSYPLQKHRPFSSEHRRWTFFSDDSESGSAVYRHVLKFQRPSTIEWRDQLLNSASFIGTVDRPVQRLNSHSHFGAYTFLNVKTSPHPHPNHHLNLKLLLKMWHEMAQISITHLKPNDFIYVSGHLESYTKAYDNGKLTMFYQINVKEINYVAEKGQGHGQAGQKAEQSGSGANSGESDTEKIRNRVNLWHVFFTNPQEWRDHRKNKVNPKHPDFKNKDSGEALWLSRDDPPWITRQLQLYDSRLSGKSLETHVSSPLEYDDSKARWDFP